MPRRSPSIFFPTNLSLSSHVSLNRHHLSSSFLESAVFSNTGKISAQRGLRVEVPVGISVEDNDEHVISGRAILSDAGK